jgi:hypothetical protein
MVLIRFSRRDFFLWVALKERITDHKTGAEEDEALFLHDMTFCTLAEDLPGHWDGSAAQRLLRKERHRAQAPPWNEARVAAVETA